MFTRAKAASLEKPRRFYAGADAGPVEGGFGVLLDGRPARTPDGTLLSLPTEALAGLIAAEWASQGEQIVFAAMPATRLAFTAIDRMASARDATADAVAAYAGADLVCYFAEDPSGLVKRQRAAWTPLLDWARGELGLDFQPAAGIVHREQPAATIEAVRALALRLDDFGLTGLAHGAGLFGSAVIALALQRGRLDGEGAFAASRVDQAWQEELWSVDSEAAERTASLRAEASTLERWFRALG